MSLTFFSLFLVWVWPREGQKVCYVSWQGLRICPYPKAMCLNLPTSISSGRSIKRCPPLFTARIVGFPNPGKSANSQNCRFWGLLEGNGGQAYPQPRTLLTPPLITFLDPPSDSRHLIIRLSPLRDSGAWTPVLLCLMLPVSKHAYGRVKKNQ